MRKIKTRDFVSLLLIVFISMSSFVAISLFTFSAYKSFMNSEDENMDGNIDDLMVSETFQVGSKYALSEWWNTTYRFRIGIEVEELDGIDRYEPVEIYLEFAENEFYQGTGRLVAYYGPSDWSDPLPVQVWDVEKYSGTDFIENCLIVFIANVSANSNQTYFFYYNENDNNIDTNYNYNTGFSSQFTAGTTLSVTVQGDSGADYEVIMEEGAAVGTLEKDGVNFHSSQSLVPEKQLSHESLAFLAHLDENTGTLTADATGNEGYGTMGGYGTGSDPPAWASGIVNYGVDFETSEAGYEWITWANGLQDAGEPFHRDSKQFTLTCWIKPESITSTAQTNHATRNCFMAKASDGFNDNFEIGITNDGRIHLYLDTYRRDGYTDIGTAGDIVVGSWNFIALVVDFELTVNSVELRINDDWYYSTYWDSADASNEMDQAEGSPFTIGGSEHTDQSWDGVIDEVAIYSAAISHEDIEKYKYASSPATIDTITPIVSGQVFSRYQVEWSTAFDMHTTDIVSFYYDYNLWNINRTIYFENPFNGTSDLAKMSALNTYYDLSGIDDHTTCKYVYDGVVQTDITSTSGLMAENYTIVYNQPDPVDDAIGIFITNYTITDPARATISYLKGAISYYDEEVRFSPGSITDYDNDVGNYTKKLIINFWEYCDRVPYTTDNALAHHFNNISLALKNPINIYVYEDDSRFYNMEVYVEDHDGRPVPEATVTLWNETDHSMTWTQQTDATGMTTFRRLNNGTYLVNASYERFSQELTITTPQVIELNETTVDVSGVKEVNFLNVGMTSIALNLSRYYQGDYKGPVAGAKLNFTFYDDGDSTGEVLSGYESTNSTGTTYFRWKNTTAGNVSISIQWFDAWQLNIWTPADNIPGDVTIINLNFTDYAWHEVAVNSSTSYETNLVIYDQGLEDKQLGESISLWVNFTYLENTTVKVMDPTSVVIKMSLKIGAKQITTSPLILNWMGDGNWSLTIDTSQEIEAGVSWLSSISYTVTITATKPGFETVIDTTEITLLDLTARLTANDTTFYANWNENLALEVLYEYDDSGTWTPITGATVTYYVLQAPSVSGSFTSIGNGVYRLVVNSTEFPGTDDYYLIITANLQNYEAKSLSQSVTILEIRTRLNDSLSVFKSVEVYFGEEEIFYFDYTVAETGTGLSSAQTMEFDWEKQNSDTGQRLAGGYDVSLNDDGNGIYSLDFDTEDLDIATYIFDITIKKNNYEERRATIYLYIIKRVFSTDALSIYSVVSGNHLQISLSITDFSTSQPITDIPLGSVYVMFQGQNFDFTYDATNGVYKAIITTIPGNVFLMPVPISAQIVISRENYTTAIIPITINVGMMEIFPGMPTFWFLMIVGSITAVAVSLITYRTIQRRRIPTFVKKAAAARKAIESKGKIGESLLYPPKDEFTVKLLGEKWEALGLSLGDILGVEGKKGKAAPGKTMKNEEFKGGGM